MINKKDSFLESVDLLYKNIDSWLSPPIVTKRRDIMLEEEEHGKYKAQELIIKRKGEKNIAILEPIASVVIGAMGRVDIKGDYNEIILLYFDIKNIKPNDILFFKGIEKTGWYWIESTLRARAQLVDKDLFFDLISEVSDEEIE